MELGISTTKKNRISIYADGEFLFTVPAVIWYSSRFREGDEVTEKDLEELRRESDLACAFDSAMRMLSLRAHSEYELKIKLKQKFSEDAVVFAIDKLRNLKLLDDESFAFNYAEELYRRKGFAPKRIV
ncbi:MAG: RecX family transcriptional regulator, partial [Clostridia bacterium]|nr:RecX family transcriptional regulator [Clostridia bacterium]